MAKLTAKQEAFAKEVVLNGGKKADAYKKHYSVSGMGAASISVEADKLYNHPKVSLKIKELQDKASKKAEESFLWSTEDRLKMLFEIASVCAASKSDDETGELKLINPTAAISAIDQANKMTGDHAAIKQKTELTGELEISKPKEEIEAELLALGIDPSTL